MTRQDAESLIEAWSQSHGINTGLNPSGVGAVSVEGTGLYFEHDEKAQTLKCSALVYRFREAPKPGVLDGFRAEEKAGTDTGGGKVDFEPENKSLFLSRTYHIIPDAETFDQDMRRLMEASQVWGDEVLDRVASKVFHPEELKK